MNLKRAAALTIPATMICVQIAQAQPPRGLEITELKGTAALTSAGIAHELKTGDALPPLTEKSEASVRVHTGQMEIISSGGFRLRANAGAAYSVDAKNDTLHVKTEPGSAPLQITDTSGNVAVVTENSSFDATHEKKGNRYAAAMGKVILTDTDGNSYILLEGDHQSVSLKPEKEQSKPQPADTPAPARASTEPASAPQPGAAQEDINETPTGN